VPDHQKLDLYLAKATSVAVTPGRHTAPKSGVLHGGILSLLYPQRLPSGLGQLTVADGTDKGDPVRDDGAW
jgi:hypothetical protein